jgi:hypothetical protein
MYDLKINDRQCYTVSNISDVSKTINDRKDPVSTNLAKLKDRHIFILPA